MKFMVLMTALLFSIWSSNVWAKGMITPVPTDTATPGPAATPTPIETAEVTFDSLRGLTESHGRSLDGTVPFYFSEESHPGSIGDELSARGSAFVTLPQPLRGKQQSPELIEAAKVNACRLAVLAALVTFQERAKQEGANGVTGVRTYAEMFISSGKRERCLCRVGARAYTTVKGRLVKTEK
jgi:hypothetical protein